MIWGYAGLWPGEFNVRDGDPVLNQLRFAREHGFRSCSFGLRVTETPERLEQVAQMIAENDLRPAVHFRAPYFRGDMAKVHRRGEQFLRELEKYGELLQVSIVTTTAGRVHRFMDQPCLEEQMDVLAEALAPVARGCYELGYPLGIENHGDYYCSDLAGLCERVPRLGIFLDTGNTYLIGERSVPGCREAAPYAIGTHFKDHRVHPDPRELKFVVEGAPLGRGDVGLREVFRGLLELAPDPDGLVMLWEMLPPRDMDPFQCLEESWEFVRTLQEEADEWRRRSRDA